jgi:hypothetical protein
MGAGIVQVRVEVPPGQALVVEELELFVCVPFTCVSWTGVIVDGATGAMLAV